MYVLEYEFFTRSLEVIYKHFLLSEFFAAVADIIVGVSASGRGY